MRCGPCGAELPGPVWSGGRAPPPPPRAPPAAPPPPPPPPGAPPPSTPCPPDYPAYPPPLYPGYAYYPMGPPRAPLDGLREVGSVVWSGGGVVFTIAALLRLATFLFLAGTMIAPGIMTAGPTDCVVNSAGARGPCAAVLFLVSPVPPFIHAMAGPLVWNAFLLYFLLLMAFVVAAYLVHLRDGRHLLESAKRPLTAF